MSKLSDMSDILGTRVLCAHITHSMKTSHPLVNWEEQIRQAVNPTQTPEAKFLVIDWRDTVDYGIWLSYRPAANVGWRAGTTTLGVNFTPQVRD